MSPAKKKKASEGALATAAELKAKKEAEAAEELGDVLAPQPAPGGDRRPVLLDTNALMMQFQFHIDLESEIGRILDFPFEVVVADTVLDELNGLVKKSKGKESQEAKLAYEFAKTFRVEKTEAPGDAGILRLSEKLNAVVVTNDKILRARLRAKGIPNIHMRSKAFLTLEGHAGF